MSFLPLFTTWKLPQPRVFFLIPSLLHSPCHPSCLEHPACTFWSPDFRTIMQSVLKQPVTVPQGDRLACVLARSLLQRGKAGSQLDLVDGGPTATGLELNADQMSSQLLVAPGLQGSAAHLPTRGSGWFQYCSAVLPPTMPTGEAC